MDAIEGNPKFVPVLYLHRQEDVSNPEGWLSQDTARIGRERMGTPVLPL